MFQPYPLTSGSSEQYAYTEAAQIAPGFIVLITRFYCSLRIVSQSPKLLILNIKNQHSLEQLHDLQATVLTQQVTGVVLKLNFMDIELEVHKKREDLCILGSARGTCSSAAVSKNPRGSQLSTCAPFIHC